MLASVILLFLTISFAQDDCSQYLDDCQYYACISEQKNCKPSSYLLGFGKKYCVKFESKRNKFSLSGQKFIQDTKMCLIQNLDKIQEDDNRELDCKEFKKIALEHHVPCYIESGFCQLPKKDRNRVIRNVLKSMWRPSLVKSGLKILNACKKLRD